MNVYIKNMVCQGTRYCVLLELKKLGIKYSKFEFDEIEFNEDLSSSEIDALEVSLRKYGLEMIFMKSSVVGKIRQAILDLVKNDKTLKTSFSYYISNSLGYNFTYLNKYFKDETGIPIEEYYLEKKNRRMNFIEPAWSDEPDRRLQGIRSPGW
jgi:hypothetical protein